MVDGKIKTIDYIKQISRHYVPEWSFNEENPDLGVSFALAFAHMAEDSLRNYDKLLNKHYIAFLNCLGMEPLPQQSAAGYATFKLANGAPHGEVVPCGTVLYNEETDVPYIVDEDLFVTPAVLKEVYCRFDDKIFKVVDLNGQNPGNVQPQECFILHKWAFAELSPDSTIELDFGEKITEGLDWAYSGLGFEPFPNVVYDNGKVCLTTGGNKFLAAEVYGYTGLFIRVIPNPSADFPEMVISNVKIRIFADNVQAKYLFHRDTEILAEEFYPFGKMLMPYDCFYIACNEVFSQKGAAVTIRFKTRTEQCKPIGSPPSDKNSNNKAVKIEQVSIDYWNGKNFVTLIPYIKNPFRAENLFCPDGQEQEKKIIFNCPDDMESYIFNGIENRWIRIRILEVSNIYQGALIYEAPVLKDVKISYDCVLKEPPGVIFRNNMKLKVLARNEPPQKISEKTPTGKHGLFLGFDKPFGGKAINFLIKPDTNEPLAVSEMAFYACMGNTWEKIMAVDKTENLNSTGIITLFLHEQPQLKELFGKKLYWLRAEFGGNKGREEMKNPPLLSINNFFINTAPITQKSHWQKETFLVDMDESQPDGLIELCLKGKNMADVEVWINGGQFGEYRLNLQESVLVLAKDSLKNINMRGPVMDIVVNYCSSMGDEGNCAENLITQMPASIGYVQYVTNPLPISGGRSLETAEQMINRRTKRLRHRQRAVTSGDFEALAHEYAGGLLKCRCYEKNAEGADVTGHVTIVYIPQKYPQTTEQLSEGIRAYLLERSHPMFSRGNRLTVREVVYMPVSVTLTLILVLDSAKIHPRIQEKLKAELDSFLNPVTGNFKKEGFDFGELPDEQLIKQFLYSLPGVDMFEDFKLEYSSQSKAPQAYTVPVPGEHKIDIKYIATIQSFKCAGTI